MLETLFFGCAVFGGTLLLIQFFLTAMGFGGGEGADGSEWDSPDADVGHPVDHSGAYHFFRVISFRTMVAGLTIFGLGGLAALSGFDQFGLDSKYKGIVSVGIAVILGLVAVFTVYYLYGWLYSLRSDGSVQEKTLLGATGTVYVKIPPQGSGFGKVLVNHQSRTMEYEASTAGAELKSGTPITVVRLISGTTVEVAAS